MADIGYIKKFKAGDPVRAVSNVEDHNRIANIWNTIEGIGCRIHKPLNGDGRGWAIIVDGSNDIVPPVGLHPVGVKESIEYDASDGKLHLVNDTAAPGNSEYYGTDTGGTKGWYAIPLTWGNLTNPPEYILGKDTAGNVGWVGVCQP